MIERYQTKELKDIWSDQNKINIWKNIESSVVYFYEKKNDLNHDTSNEINNITITSDEIKEEEKVVKHEFLSFINVLENKCKNNNKIYIHKGLTSSDVLDTTFSIQLRDSAIILKKSIGDLLISIENKINDNINKPILGRTHGICAELTDISLIFGGFYSEWLRHLNSITDVIKHVSYGKISGPVGNYSHLDLELEEFVLNQLNLNVEPISTQIIPRDRYAKYFMNLAVIASSIDRFANEIRLYSQSGIDEMYEGFSTGQKGSSAMPHKRNPIQCENLSGISRIIRTNCFTSLENIALWHERDMSHSSVERFIGPDVTSLLHYSINKMKSIIDNLFINHDKIIENINKTKHMYMSHHLLNYLIDNKSMNRIEAYDIIQGISKKCINENLDLIDYFKTHIDNDFEYHNLQNEKTLTILKRIFE